MSKECSEINRQVIIENGKKKLIIQKCLLKGSVCLHVDRYPRYLCQQHYHIWYQQRKIISEYKKNMEKIGLTPPPLPPRTNKMYSFDEDLYA